MLRQWFPSDRRTLGERRSNQRRHIPLLTAAERRAGAERRSGTDRRESAPGHLRNALQVLQELEASLANDTEGMEKLTAAARRLWLALVEIERPPRADDSTRLTVGGRLHELP